MLFILVTIAVFALACAAGWLAAAIPARRDDAATRAGAPVYRALLREGVPAEVAFVEAFPRFVTPARREAAARAAR